MHKMKASAKLPWTPQQPRSGGLVRIDARGATPAARTAHRAARVAEQRIARRGHEPPAVQIQAARDQRGDVDQSGDLLLVGGRLRGGRDGQHTHRAPEPGRPRSVPANRSTASRWRSALGCT
jgi:hypothetical protein